jgi:coupling of ubiquitin conjugation to ER degradation protein 1
LPVPASSAAATTTPAQAKPLQPDLITRYNLKAKVAEEATRREGSEGTEEETTQGGKQKQGQAWSSNKAERQALLQQRREEMILAARRKMEAKVAAESGLGKPGI